MSTWIGGLDVGTQSARFVIFDENKQALGQHQLPYSCSHPHPGWVEQDPNLLFKNCKEVMDGCVQDLINKNKLSSPNHLSQSLKAFGIANQRETIILWDKKTGEPLYPAIVWSDNRCADMENELQSKLTEQQIATLKEKTGLRLSCYFSAFKVKWLIENVKNVQEAIKENRCMFGTVDTWILWKLSGQTAFVTDITNASRTLLCNIITGQWDDELLEMFSIPKEILLPDIRSSAEEYCKVSGGMFSGVPVTACLGDQQAALVGNGCLKPGQAKNTYGTGCFLLFNTGTTLDYSSSGLLSTVAYQLGPSEPIHYAFEGSISTAGSAVTWLVNNLKIISSPKEASNEAESVENTHGVYFVPAFKGLYAPRWNSEARGVLLGLSGSENRGHLCRAVFESIAYQSKEILDVMYKESHLDIGGLNVDGGMTNSDIFLQIQADVLGVEIHKPNYGERTVFGAAFAAGLQSGVYNVNDSLAEDSITVYKPSTTPEQRNIRFARWCKAVECACMFTAQNPDEY